MRIYVWLYVISISFLFAVLGVSIFKTATKHDIVAFFINSSSLVGYFISYLRIYL